MINKKSENVHTALNAVTSFQESEAIQNMKSGIAEIPIAISLNID